MDVQEPAADSETVGEGDTQQQPIAGETTPEQIETTTQPAEEIETQVEDDAFSIKVPSQKEQIIKWKSLE